MKKFATSILLLSALTFGLIACQNEKKKTDEGSANEAHADDDGHNHDAESKNVHLNDTTNAESHVGHDHAATDTTHTVSDGHNH
ncbi:MAG: hypothetical protein ACO1G2_05550 [Bacteroidota bacterium]